MGKRARRERVRECWPRALTHDLPMLGTHKMANTTSHEPVIGYFKVFTTEGRHVRDHDAHEGPGGRAYTCTDPNAAARRNISQWIFPFTKRSREAAHTKALAKADVVLGRLDGQGTIEEFEIDGMDNAYAIRVGKQ